MKYAFVACFAIALLSACDSGQEVAQGYKLNAELPVDATITFQ